jgi:hypothetical protein
MVVPRGAKHRVDWDAIPAGDITHDMLENNAVETVNIKDDAVDATKINDADDFIMGTLEATKVTGTSRLVTKQGLHTGVALADLTATFGDPAALDNGSLFVYKNSTDNKTYLVVVIQSVFQIEELTPVTA